VAVLGVANLLVLHLVINVRSMGRAPFVQRTSQIWAVGLGPGMLGACLLILWVLTGP
jgi:hypothetical protein